MTTGSWHDVCQGIQAASEGLRYGPRELDVRS